MKMPKKLFILFALLCLVSISYAQLDRYYWLNIPKYNFPKKNSNYTLCFCLSNEGNYTIKIEQLPYHDIVILGYTISTGEYKVKNGIIHLTDSFTGCKMTFQLDGSNLKPLKTYQFINNIVFNDYAVCGGIDKDKRNNETPVEKRISSFETKIINNNNPFSVGLFSHKWGDIFTIILDKEGNYEYSFKAMDSFPFSNKLDLCLIISTGTWERKGNILTLWDTNLQHYFYALIHKDGSIEPLFFRWVDEMIFKKN
jgi:hypothetical protein